MFGKLCKLNYSFVPTFSLIRTVLKKNNNNELTYSIESLFKKLITKKITKTFIYLLLEGFRSRRVIKKANKHIPTIPVNIIRSAKEEWGRNKLLSFSSGRSKRTSCE